MIPSQPLTIWNWIWFCSPVLQSGLFCIWRPMSQETLVPPPYFRSGELCSCLRPRQTLNLLCSWAQAHSLKRACLQYGHRCDLIVKTYKLGFDEIVQYKRKKKQHDFTVKPQKPRLIWFLSQSQKPTPDRSDNQCSDQKICLRSPFVPSWQPCVNA